MAQALTEKDQVCTLYYELLRQWNKQDAAAMAGLFTEDGNMIGFDGSQLNGQKEIHSVLDEIFSNFPTATYVSILKDIRLLSADCGILIAAVGMVPRGQADINPAVNAIQTLTATKVNGDWRIAIFQNTPAAFHGRPELSEQLCEELRYVLRKAQ